MTFIENLYLSDNITEDTKKLKKRLNKPHKCLSYYLLTISDISDGMIDIIPAFELSMWPAQYKDNLIVIGISKGTDKASEMVANLATEVFNECGHYNIRSYFKDRIEFEQVRI